MLHDTIDTLISLQDFFLLKGFCIKLIFSKDFTNLFGLFTEWNPGSLLQARLKRMTSGDYSQPSWELNMARKDTQLFLNAAEKAKRNLAVIPAVAERMDEWIKKGHGSEDWMRIVQN